MVQPDVVIIGAGAAGLMCAAEAGKRGRRVVVLDHARKPGEKIRISGGGRCNFTNIHASPKQYLSRNPHFCVSALARYTPQDFIGLVQKHGIAFHEKTLGQLFCDGSSQQIIDLLLAECRQAGVEIRLATAVLSVSKKEESFCLVTDRGDYQCDSLVVACGGLSIPKMGATGLGYEIARQFGIEIVPTSPGLVPFTLGEKELAAELSGVATEAVARCGKQQFREGMLFTHRGLSGPAILQISSYWREGQEVMMNLAPDVNILDELVDAKAGHPKQETATVLAQWLPKRLVQRLGERCGVVGRVGEVSHKQLMQLADAVNRWRFIPQGTEGYRTAEVTLGGVDTVALSSKTMECQAVRGLYFIGEVVDVTGHLGGYNFQWAWASGHAAGQYV